MDHSAGLLSGRSVLITGANRGIGLAVARTLAEHGALVIVHARTQQAADETVAKLSAARGQRHLAVHGDLLDLGTADSIARQLQQLGVTELHVLIHNAGILGKPPMPLENYPLDEYDRVMRVNVTAPLAVTQRLLPLVRRANRPSIIFVSSGAGLRREKGPSGGIGVYSISKFALEGLTNNLALELQPEGIRVNAVNPGPTRTELRRNALPDEDPMTLPAPEDITPIFVYHSRAEPEVTNTHQHCRDWIGKDVSK